MTAGNCARVSTLDQDPAAQLEQLRTYCQARGWEVREHVDHGVSGAKQRRPGLDALLQAVRRRTVDVVVCTKLDRLARSLEHLVRPLRGDEEESDDFDDDEDDDDD